MFLKGGLSVPSRLGLALLLYNGMCKEVNGCWGKCGYFYVSLVAPSSHNPYRDLHSPSSTPSLALIGSFFADPPLPPSWAVSVWVSLSEKKK